MRSWRPQEGIDQEISAALEALKQKPEGMEPEVWANAWCLQQPCVSTVIPGIKSLEQLELNALAGDISL